MNQQQLDSFAEGAGGFGTAPDLFLAVQGIGGTLIFLYVSWVCVKSYQEYCSGQSTSGDMLITWGRSVFIMTVLTYLLTN